MANNLAIDVRNACKSYGKQEVLKGLAMQVQKGTIYGLLGASGCGKTTLLNCIVGRNKLNSGTIWVLGGTPGTENSGVPGPRVGYMPQEVGLLGEFTIKDAMYYFGRILDTPDKLIEERFYELTKILDLPSENQLLKHCSGGEQRRVSFAVSIVHMPELLILDEPTAGVDPLLRERIWDYLLELTTRKQITVIITTHYIEEARQANVIGLMRDGILLAQESPAKLLSIFETDSLEEVFLILSRSQEEGKLNNITLSSDVVFHQSIQNSSSDINVMSQNSGSTDVLTKNNKTKMKAGTGAFSFKGRRIMALMDKNWKQFYRNAGGVVFLLLIPFIVLLAFLFAVGRDVTDIPLAIVNHETMSLLCTNFTTNGTAVPYDYSSCHFKDLSCRFLPYLEIPMIRKVQYDSLEAALDASKRGDVVGVLYMADNFTESFERRMEDGRNLDPEVLDLSQIKIWLDMSNRQIGASMKYKLLMLYQRFAKDLVKDCNYSPKAIDFWQVETFYGDVEDSFTVFMTPGIIITVLFFLGNIMTSHIVVTERSEGVWERSTVAGVTSLEITLTHFLLQGVIMVIHTIETFILIFVIFGIKHSGSIWILLALTLLQGLLGMCFGFWVSIISNNFSTSNIIATGSFYFMILLSGTCWPLEGMPLFLQWISRFTPFTVAIEAFRNVMRRGWSIGHLQVLVGFLIEIVWIVGLTIVNILLLKSKRQS